MHSEQVTEPQEMETKVEGRMATICSSFLLDSVRFNDYSTNLKFVQGRAGLHV
jgi:hypothetical protein